MLHEVGGVKGLAGAMVPYAMSTNEIGEPLCGFANPMASLQVEDMIYLGRAFISHSSELWSVYVRSIPSGREY